MLFNSLEFAVFFIVVYGVYLFCGRRLAWQNALLLLASYYFYSCWDWRFLGLIWLSTVLDFVCGRLLDRRKVGAVAAEGDDQPYALSGRGRRRILAVSVVANLGILGVFKYYDFFATSAAEFLGTIGLPMHPRLLEIALPVGISFYTFQTLSYTIDIYRGHMRASRSLLQFAVFVAFFPQLVAGPIVRARDFLPQVSRPRLVNSEQSCEGGMLILWGLFKKIVISGNLAPLVEAVFWSGSTDVSGGAVVVASYAFAVQVYCDFSGYSDIARGCAKMLGFELQLNFNLPFLASNPSAFWQRWHISLSTWLRDYVYFPLGGSRKGARRTSINLIITMVLSGLWHGAAWTFVVWGMFWGVLLVSHRAMAPALDRFAGGLSGASRVLWKVSAVVCVFTMFSYSMLMFCSQSLAEIGQHTMAIFSGVSLYGSGARTLCLFSLPLVIMQLAQYFRGDLNVLLRLPAPVRGVAYAMMFYGIVLIGEGVDQPFVYFQF